MNSKKLIICAFNIALKFLDLGLYASSPSDYVISSAEKTQLEQLQSELSNGSLNQVCVKRMLWDAARFNYQKIFDILLELPDTLRPSQEDINEMLVCSARFSNKAMIEKLLNLPSHTLSPNQEGINLVFINVAGGGHEDLVDMLLDCSRKHPDQLSVNAALELSVETGHSMVTKLLMNRQEEQLRPDQDGIIAAYHQAILKNSDFAISLLEAFVPEEEKQNKRLVEATRLGNKVAVEGLLSVSLGQPSPNQAGINIALISASTNGNSTLVELFMNSHKNLLRPDQRSIILAYREAVERRFALIITTLNPFVPETERQNHRLNGEYNKGIAFEIHNYANTKVKASASKTISLIDSVLNNVQDRISSTMAYSKAKTIIGQAINRFIPIAQQADAKRAIFYRLASDIDYEEQLRLIITFMQTFHKDKMGQWIAGFVNESIIAYVNSNNPTSCSKGIRERVVTGLRGIDAELDKFFAQAEAPILMKNWLKAWNLPELKNEAKQELAMQLKSKGITESSSSADAANAFKELAKEQLAIHGMQDHLEILAEIDIYAESMLEANYEKELKSFV